MGFPFVCHPDWPDSIDFLAARPTDLWEVNVIRAWLRPGDSAMDLGANLGLYAFGMSDRIGSHGKVLAVDADGFGMLKLKQAAQLATQPQINVLHGAVLDRNGEVLFYVRSDHSITGTQSLLPDPAEEQFHTGVPTPCYRIESLSERIGNAEKIAAIKIDIEGAEALAFKAVPPALFSADGPFWLVEIHPSALARFNAQPIAITHYFSSDEFDLFLKPKHPLAHSSSGTALRRLLAEEAYADSLYYNLLAIPRGKHWRERRQSIAHLIPGLDG